MGPVISRLTKNNPVLIGDPSVGNKTAIVEGIAQRIDAGDVPDSLMDSGRVGHGGDDHGASYRGEFKDWLKEVVDWMHTVVDTGATQGSTDARNLLKPALAHGQLRCIDATTIDEYHTDMEKDTRPSSDDSSRSTLTSPPLRTPHGTMYNGVRIRDKGLLVADKLSSRYLPDRFLPDKAINLVEEVCTKLKNELTSNPTALDEVDQHIVQLEMEKLSLSSDASKALDGKAAEANRTRLEQLELEVP
ncbi:LOW QUALITY PROTEIN: hypothetical protein ACHAWF_002977 [Thalassiosira exigua]